MYSLQIVLATKKCAGNPTLCATEVECGLLRQYAWLAVSMCLVYRQKVCVTTYLPTV